MLPKESDWDVFYQAIKQKTGLDLYQYKPDQLRRRTLSMMETRGTATLADFWTSVQADPNGVSWFLDRMAINVSELYRNPEKWVEMKEKILPELLQNSNTLKVWSAGCSIGAEAHTLATQFEEYFQGRHTIIGTDIDKAALAQAQSGVYSVNDMKCVPLDIKKKYFLEEDGKFTAKPEIRKYLRFKEGDLLSDKFETGFDLIMCRNVVIYFTEPAKDVLYRKFFEALKPGGILFVGSTERIFQAKDIGFESTLPFYYKRPREKTALWRSAS
ncbi:MAG: protein-glutamate O-methyltransferase CheR [Armatimonadetes bacterium]|nr:protein-glutamate O-methyltransferase CheR [Armatimonadota bacterium]